MIRGVSRYTVEINQTGSPYFERAICFVRPEFARCNKVDLHKAAGTMLGALDGLVEEYSPDEEDDEAQEAPAKRAYSRLPRWIIPALSALFGAGAALLAALAVG